MHFQFFSSCCEVNMCKRVVESLGPLSFNEMGLNELACEVWD